VKTLKIQDPFKEGAFYRIILKVTFLVKAKANKAVLQTSRSPGFFPNNMNRFKLWKPMRYKPYRNYICTVDCTFPKRLDGAKQDCGARTQISASGSRHQELFLAPAPPPTFQFLAPAPAIQNCSGSGATVWCKVNGLSKSINSINVCFSEFLQPTSVTPLCLWYYILLAWMRCEFVSQQHYICMQPQTRPLRKRWCYSVKIGGNSKASTCLPSYDIPIMRVEAMLQLYSSKMSYN